MKVIQKIQKIESLLAEDKVKKALSELLGLLNEIEEYEEKKEVIVNSATLSRVNRAFNNSMISWEESSIMKNRIIMGTLTILENLKEAGIQAHIVFLNLKKEKRLRKEKVLIDKEKKAPPSSISDEGIMAIVFVVGFLFTIVFGNSKIGMGILLGVLGVLFSILAVYKVKEIFKVLAFFIDRISSTISMIISPNNLNISKIQIRKIDETLSELADLLE